jgi:two-component system, NtrC family, response regulator HydG
MSFSDSPTEARKKLEVSALGRSFTFTVIQGPDQGKKFSCDTTRPLPLLFGKSEACEARLSDTQVSRRHAAVELVGERLRLKDLGSTNGTAVNSVQVVEAFLSGGETLTLGGTVLRVESTRVALPELPALGSFGRVLGQSAAMRKLYPLFERLAASSLPLVIEGETGTGKEQVAEALHEASARAAEPYVVFDCTAVNPNLIESELFGHERGAFTGAASARRGVFERAHGGTLLIDEVGDMPLELQAKLLRAIERSEVTRVGAERPLRVDVRVIAATRRDLDRAIQEGRFREDLFHRLAVGRIELPPLRDRQGDIALLARHFWAKLGGADALLTPAIIARLEASSWPGNVRELRNSVARLLVLGEESLSDAAELPSDASASPAPDALAALRRDDPIARVLFMDLPLSDARQKVIDEFEQRYVEHVLAQHGGNVTRAAAAAGVARRHLHRLKAKTQGSADSSDADSDGDD